MEQIETSIVINRPLEEVFTFIADPENDPQRVSAYIEATKTSEGPVGVGSTYIGHGKFLGKRIESGFTITEFEPNRKICVQTTSGPIPLKSCRTTESVADATRLVLTGESNLGSFFKLAEPILLRVAKREIEADVQTLKDLLQAGVGAARTPA